jgi:N-acetyl-1-D-myo-inositol-2-amino-2-deoxy-alpha-D-glucopyranoside deacetylase
MSGNLDLRPHTLLGVFAHPDDESLACGGVMAACAAAGAHVALLCLTRGAGVPAVDEVAAVRAKELDAALRVLGVRSVFVLDHADGYLPWIDAPTLERDIRHTIDRVKPTAVVTFGEDGLYWHPDHIAVHERTTAVVSGMGTAAPALFYVTIPPGTMRSLVEAVAGRAIDGRPHTDVLGIEAVDAFGAKAQPPTHAVDVSAYAARKLHALRCHASQAGRGALALLTDEEAARYLGVEHYRRASVGSTAWSCLDVLAAPTPLSRS